MFELTPILNPPVSLTTVNPPTIKLLDILTSPLKLEVPRTSNLLPDCAVVPIPKLPPILVSPTISTSSVDRTYDKVPWTVKLRVESKSEEQTRLSPAFNFMSGRT